ncbi:MAG TPA: Ig-like domain-containing protein, partial [Chryseolinea sp.]|nr:Ig-like domain-containing protein [Chryseolinea sp.]
NIVITKNTIYRTGRSSVDMGFSYTYKGVHQNTNIDVSYNDMSQFCMMNQDGGAIYSWGFRDHTGSRIHHNWFHDAGFVPNPLGITLDGIQVATYFDQASGPFTVDHNVYWNNCENLKQDAADHYTQPQFEHRNTGPSRVYNNTFYSNAPNSYVTYITVPLDDQKNNIYRKGIVVSYVTPVAANVSTSLRQGSTPQFVGGDLNALKGLYFRPSAASPARDAGTVIPGITDGSVGVPDIGAYEYGGTAWVPGYTPQAGIPSTNSLPVVGLTSPANNSTFGVAAPITISANATDADGTITRVEFFSGTTKIGEDLTSPYSFVWNNAAAGTYALTAKATDNVNAVTTSAPVTVIVSAGNTPPTVAITSPSANALFSTGASVTITATATDNVSVTKVEFYSGTTKIGEDSSGPYSFTWANAPAGTQVITAKAYDNQNNITTSAAVTVTISPAGAPVTAITAPANGAKVSNVTPIVITATASDANGTITKVEFYAGTVKLGEDLSNPYSFSWANAAVGAYTLTVKAYDNSGVVTTSAGVSITVDVAISGLPSVQITAPLNNAQITAGTPINIAATATDTDGTIAKVEFYNGATLLGEDNSSPYTFAWNNATAGAHAITAKATDNQGGIATSEVINITVSAPGSSASPTISAGDDINIFLPQNSATLNGIGSSPMGAAVTFNWIQVSGPSDVNIVNPNTQSVSIDNLVEGVYVFELKVTDANGITSDDQVIVNVSSESALAGTNIPRYFTPNSDGVNDTWQWPETQLAETSQVTVFNRFGKKVYESNAYNNSWDGKSDGQVLQDDAYYYVIKRENATDIQGAVRIIR